MQDFTDDLRALRERLAQAEHYLRVPDLRAVPDVLSALRGARRRDRAVGHLDEREDRVAVHRVLDRDPPGPVVLRTSGRVHVSPDAHDEVRHAGVEQRLGRPPDRVPLDVAGRVQLAGTRVPRVEDPVGVPVQEGALAQDVLDVSGGGPADVLAAHPPADLAVRPVVAEPSVQELQYLPSRGDRLVDRRDATTLDVAHADHHARHGAHDLEGGPGGTRAHSSRAHSASRSPAPGLAALTPRALTASPGSTAATGGTPATCRSRPRRSRTGSGSRWPTHPAAGSRRR